MKNEEIVTVCLEVITLFSNLAKKEKIDVESNKLFIETCLASRTFKFSKDINVGFLIRFIYDNLKDYNFSKKEIQLKEIAKIIYNISSKVKFILRNVNVSSWDSLTGEFRLAIINKIEKIIELKGIFSEEEIKAKHNSWAKNIKDNSKSYPLDTKYFNEVDDTTIYEYSISYGIIKALFKLKESSEKTNT